MGQVNEKIRRYCIEGLHCFVVLSDAGKEKALVSTINVAEV